MTSHAMPGLDDALLDGARALPPGIVALRRDLHHVPEIGRACRRGRCRR